MPQPRTKSGVNRRSPFPMTKKRRYQAIAVNHERVEALIEKVAGARVAVGIDIAKTRQFAAFMTEDGVVHGIVRWQHPVESPDFLRLLSRLEGQGCQVEVAMEPSGTYGDALRSAMLGAGLPVFRVNPKRSHDAAEVYDGVPSLHDAKSASIVAKLHLEKLSEAWPVTSEHERALSAALRVLAIFEGQYRKNRNRLEALLARHWPELPRELDLKSATLLEVLIEFGSAQHLTRRADEARELMALVGRHFLDPSKIAAVLTASATSFGMEPTDEERVALQLIAAETRRCQKEASKAKRRVEKLTEHDGAAHRMRSVIGKTTAAVLVAAVGDPRRYHCATAYQKALGLNLKEHSSGERKKGGLHITKRGPGIARLYLYLAALRLLQADPIIRAWYAKKVKRQGGIAKRKAVVAIMRKVTMALWHVAHGAVFDASKLFDVSRLTLAAEPTAAVPA